MSLGLRAEVEDLGLSADPRSPVATPKGGPADIIFIKHIFLEIEHFEKWKRRAPPDDPFFKSLKILDMGSISSREHEMACC